MELHKHQPGFLVPNLQNTKQFTERTGFLVRYLNTKANDTFVKW